MESFFEKYIHAVENTDTIKYTGSVTAVKGLMVESLGPRCVIGEVCTIRIPSTNERLMAEVVGLEDKIVRLMPYGDTNGIEIGAEVIASGHVLEVPVGDKLLGRVIDATGRPMDGKGDVEADEYYPVLETAPDPMKKPLISKRVATGVRAIDSLLTLGMGQRVGIFAGSGVGKSTLLSVIARNTNADINVIALIGERGKEVREFIEGDLGPEGLKRSVIIVATSDRPAIARMRAAFVATAIAEYFRDKGKNVMMMFDNLTRFAIAQRDIGTSTGELPINHGYPPSVFTMLPRLLERTGTNEKGTITAIYNVLVEGDDFKEPITDTVRGTLDGHIYLSRGLAERQHYPAIDVAGSISRNSKRVTGPLTQKAMQKGKKWMADYARQEDMILAGVYQKGNSPEVDEAIDKHQAIEEFLCQEEYEHITMEDTLNALSELSGIEIPKEEYSESPAAVRKQLDILAK